MNKYDWHIQRLLSEQLPGSLSEKPMSKARFYWSPQRVCRQITCQSEQQFEQISLCHVLEDEVFILMWQLVFMKNKVLPTQRTCWRPWRCDTDTSKSPAQNVLLSPASAGNQVLLLWSGPAPVFLLTLGWSACQFTAAAAAAAASGSFDDGQSWTWRLCRY